MDESIGFITGKLKKIKQIFMIYGAKKQFRPSRRVGASFLL
jgi:hypothetical protein